MSGSTQAFNKLLDVALNARRTAKGLPSQLDIKPHWSGIGFTLFGQKFVAPMSEVTEMLELPAYTELPGVQSWVRGLANVRGRLLPLTDLAVYLGGKLEAPRRNRRVLVVENGDTYCGLIVDGILGMQHPGHAVQRRGLGGIDFPAMVPYLQGSFQEDGARGWVVFSPWQMVQDERFFQVAQAS